MKKYIFGAFIALYGLTVNAQDIEASLGYGTPSLFGVADSMLSGFGHAIVGEKSSTSSNGVLNLNVMVYNQNKKWRYGGDLGMEFFSSSGLITNKSYTSISPRVDYFWSGGERSFRFYSGVYAGLLMRSAKYIDEDDKKVSENDVFFGYNITPLAIRYGKEFGVFLESNIGTRGFLQFGISYLF